MQLKAIQTNQTNLRNFTKSLQLVQLVSAYPCPWKFLLNLSKLGKNIFAQPKVIKSARSYEPRRVNVYLENLFSDVDQGLGVQCLH